MTSNDSNYVAQPSGNGVDWYVWNACNPPPKPIFIGTMEDCGMVSGAMNAAKLDEPAPESDGGER